MSSQRSPELLPAPSGVQEDERVRDVLVIGAGPVGLTLATRLAEANSSLDVGMIDRRDSEERDDGSRAFVVHARTREYLTPSGIAGELAAHGTVTDAFNLYGKYGKRKNPGARVDFTGLDTPYNDVLLVPQPITEGVLRAYARDLEVPIDYGNEFVGFVDTKTDADYTRVLTRRTSDGKETLARARYVVGCDGSRSAVREAIGLKQIGREALQHIFLADMRLDNPPTSGIHGTGANGVFGFLASFSDQNTHNQREQPLYRMIAQSHEIDAHTPISREVRRGVLQAAFGTDFGANYEPVWTSRFDVREGLVPQYQGENTFENILLAGDSAHTHSPAGGQGMNLGIGDAVNLAWRLNSVLSHGADPSLLKDYTKERRPIAEDVINSSSKILELATSGSRLVQLGRVPLLNIALGIDHVRDKITGQLSGIGINYSKGPDDHKLVGTRLRPDEVLFARNRSIFDIKVGKFVLALSPGVLRPDIRGHENLIEVVEISDHAPPLPEIFILRPDGHVAFAQEARNHKSRHHTKSLATEALRLWGMPNFRTA